MNIFPAIDLYNGKAVRLYKGDYSQMTVYSDDPLSVAEGFRAQGAEYLHIVDLEGAKTGETPNLGLVSRITKQSGLKVEIGGGIRSESVIEKYLAAGVMRVILGTAAVTNPAFLADMVEKYGNKIAVGVDIKDGCIAIKGWTETIAFFTCDDFFARLERLGVKTVICTDISKDGVLQGTNLPLYKDLSVRYRIDVVASGGVTGITDIIALRDMNVYGAILGKALYAGVISLPEALKAALGGNI